MPPSTITIMGARRFPAVAAPVGSRSDGISVFTSTGFAALTTEDYEKATATLKPDIAIPLADLPSSGRITQPKRALRMAERTEDWMAQWFERFDLESDLKPAKTAVFAPVLPVPYPMQWEYLNRLSEEHQHALSGLAVYDTDILADLKDYSSLLPLPRLSLDEPSTPQHVLTQISLGADIFLLPFLNIASDSGIALTFTFPAPPLASSSPLEPLSGADMDVDTTRVTLLPLGIDMALPAHQKSLSPLNPGCTCYTCTHHHSAYVHHLLEAREMLGWTLLQIHNYQVLSDFFAGVRAALAEGGESFATAAGRFAAAYEAAIPLGTGTRPRARGYHFKSEGFDEKRNKPAWGNLGGSAAGGGDAAGEMVNGVEGETVEGSGVARDAVQTPLVPDGDSGELDRIRFAELQSKKA